jgi:hypothetical protein
MLPARPIDPRPGRAYKERMDSGRFPRGTIALVAAYALALQTLFAAFVPVATAIVASPFAVLCAHDADGSGGPAQHDLPCAALCAAIAHGMAGPVPPEIAAATVLPDTIAALVPVHDWATPRIVPGDIHAPRGPPLA